MQSSPPLKWRRELGFFAHTKPNAELSEWEPLASHLKLVGTLAEQFASAFNAGPWGYLAGLWHDLGKFQENFQHRLFGAAIQVEHSGAGAVRACPDVRLVDEGLALAFAIAGHHAGLTNLTSNSRSLRVRLQENLPLLGVLQKDVPPHIWSPPIPQPISWLAAAGKYTDAEKRRLAFFTRMLFSALVDADSLATEQFEGGHPLRQASVYEAIPVLRKRLDDHLNRTCAKAPPTPVNRLRAAVLADCRARAMDPQGCFSLTVPTGGGKTLSGLSFALNHAVTHELRRVIVVIPYTSIIEQNANVYRDAFGAHNVVEHHSNLDDFKEIQQSNEQAIRRRLACENWDAPLIVTTNVQFFESLFSNNRSRSRKLHNIANSVIVLDEAQNLPVGFLGSVLEALRELAANYGCSIVLSTATQPALEQRENLPTGLAAITEIAADPVVLGQDLRRVDVHWPEPDVVTSYADLSGQIAEYPAALVVVHRRDDAASLFRMLAERCQGERLFHLSALMCPVHRRQTIEAIHEELKLHRQDGRSCRVVSTQLVEAGVDLDFPVVFRALAGLDSIAQAAGRCNREGRLARDGGPCRGDVFVFRAETEPPGPMLKRAMETTCLMLQNQQGELDITDPAVFKEFFQRFYYGEELDVQAILSKLASFDFETVAKEFRLIEDGFQKAIVIPWDDEAKQRIKKLHTYDNAPFVTQDLRSVLRGLQPYTVQVQQQQFAELKQGRVIESKLDDTVWILNWELFPKTYDRETGLVWNAEGASSGSTWFG